MPSNRLLQACAAFRRTASTRAALYVVVALFEEPSGVPSLFRGAVDRLVASVRAVARLVADSAEIAERLRAHPPLTLIRGGSHASTK